MPFIIEQQYLDKGYSCLGGIDEVGRGPLAGPVVCACVVLPLDKDNIIEGINDSKKLSAKKRDVLYDKIIEKALDFTISMVQPEEIDKINILNATKKAMTECVNNLSVDTQLVFVDAVKLIDTKIPTVSFIKGDEKSYLIGAASIVAKVTRDRLMVKYDELFPQYGFAKHKGYGTKEHINALIQYGATQIHRQTFIKRFINE